MIYLHTYDVSQFSDNDSKRVLKKNLAHYLNICTSEVNITHNINGKPLIEGFSFSITHCHNILIQAFTKHGDIGIDLEFKNPKRKYLQLAKRYFDEQEYLHLCSLDEAQQIDFFYLLWTTKEAVCKAKGGRLWYYLSDNYLDDSNIDKEMRLVKSAQQLNLQQIDAFKNYSFTIASESPIDTVRFCDE